ncbi:hypothetical protein NE237_004689 [Protea cynaroides]|uniref:Uncharacterized protein n=1 Tax=Protea cynaroides TaxID=273540 RepID=A0A9Q0QTK5_9MAGN|nr:hypothetical protein NE237_004689 [Protea cynaroides]
MICSFLLENVVETQVGGGLKRLMKYCGGDIGEESSDTFSLEDLDADGDGFHSWWRWRRSSGGGGGGAKGEFSFFDSYLPLVFLLLGLVNNGNRACQEQEVFLAKTSRQEMAKSKDQSR